MKRVYEFIDSEKEKLHGHSLFRDALKISEDEVEDKLKIWAPLFVHLTMTFRDINLFYYAYQYPKSPLEAAVNAHAKIDSCHWHYLVNDLKKIGIYNEICNYEDAMNIIWSTKGDPIRNYIYSVLRRAQTCFDSPLLRATAMESGETTVKMFFQTTRYVAAIFKEKTGKSLQYFGDDHINSEIDNSVDTKLFESVELDLETYRIAMNIVKEHFEEFKVFLDYKYFLTFNRQLK